MIHINCVFLEMERHYKLAQGGENTVFQEHRLESVIGPDTRSGNGPIHDCHIIEEDEVFIFRVNEREGAKQFTGVGADSGYFLENPPGIECDSHLQILL
jgi:hypothetical protein